MPTVNASGGQHAQRETGGAPYVHQWGVTGPAPYERAYRSERSQNVYRPTRRVCAYYDSPVDVRSDSLPVQDGPL